MNRNLSLPPPIGAAGPIDPETAVAIPTAGDAGMVAAEAVLMAATDAMVLTDSSRQTVVLNDAARRLLGSDRMRLNFGRMAALVRGLRQRSPDDSRLMAHFQALTADPARSCRSDIQLRGLIPQILAVTSRPASADGRLQIWVIRDQSDAIRVAANCRSCASDARAIHDALLARTEAMSRARTAAEAARAGAERVSRARTEFMAHLSHELRTPLNAIRGFSEVIAREMMGPAGSPTYVDYARSIHTSGTELLSLIDDILDLSRIETGRLPIRPEPIDLCGLVRRICDSRAHAVADDRAADHDQAVVQTDLPDHPVMIIGDTAALARAISHLLDTALRAAPPASPVIIQVTQSRHRTDIAIIDGGSVMTAVEIENALAAFGDTDSLIARGGRGRGLALSVAQALVRLQGGTLDIAPRDEGGMVTRIHFPLAAS